MDEMGLENQQLTTYMLVNERMGEIASRMWIDEDGMVDIVYDGCGVLDAGWEARIL